MTERLYYHDARLLRFDANVVAHVADANHVVLDRTAFYPTSGGQPHDTGRLGDAHVVDVLDDDGRVVHVVDAPIPLGPVHGEVDGVRRLDHTQQHTAQHLLSALAADRLGWQTVSVHFGAEHSTIEFDTAAATERELSLLERLANEVVARAEPVTVTFEDAAAAERAGLRKPATRAGSIRVVTITGIDRSACGGTHVSRTSEIGAVLVVGTERIRGRLRVGFVAGTRTIAQAHRDRTRLDTLAHDAGCGVDELESLLRARLDELKRLRDHAGRLENEVAAARVRSLADAAVPGAGGLRDIRLLASEESPAMLRAMAQAVAGLTRVRLLAIGNEPPTIYLATSADSGIDAGATLRAALAANGGRGGGSARVAQGTAPSSEALRATAEAVAGR